MAQLVTSGPATYCTPAELLAFIDANQLAGLLRDDPTQPLPTAGDLANPATDAGARLAALLAAGSGEVEAACLPRGQYAADDLAAVYASGTNAQYHLVRVTAGCTILAAFARRHTASRTSGDDYPAAAFAAAALERLRTGEHVFGMAANLAAGAGTQAVPFVSNDPADPNRTVNQAARFFGVRGPTCGGY